MIFTFSPKSEETWRHGGTSGASGQSVVVSPDRTRVRGLRSDDVCSTPDSDTDIEHVPISVFADEAKLKKYGVGIGDEVFIAGLFTKVTETTQNIPIVRVGNVAMMCSMKEFHFITVCMMRTLLSRGPLGG